jgi:predicted amidohydrolase YtcJ
VKFFADGVYDGKTALTLHGYPGEPDNLGTSIFEPEHYGELVTQADALGFQIATHAVGDGAIHLALDAYEQARTRNGARDSRHRVEHIEVIDPSDIPRFAELGVIASMQPLHAPISPADAEMWFQYVPRKRWQDAFVVRRLRDTGARVVLGSDWSVVTMNPFVSWQAAVTRTPWGDEGSAHFQQNLIEVMAGYTKDAAYAEFQEDYKGQLKVGMLADMVLLSEDVIALPTEDLGSLTVKLTIVDGKIVYMA